MREILFRGQRKDNGEWVCSGNLIQFFDNNIREVYISQYGERCNAVHDIDTDNIETITCENGARFYKVIPETVGQYTGLTDKNGTKIFEGDIVKTQHFYDRPYSDKRKSKQFIGTVDYKIRTFNGNSFYPKQDYQAEWGLNFYEDFGKYTHYNWGELWNCEIIGNIHDNSELLKEGDTK